MCSDLVLALCSYHMQTPPKEAVSERRAVHQQGYEVGNCDKERQYEIDNNMSVCKVEFILCTADPSNNLMCLDNTSFIRLSSNLLLVVVDCAIEVCDCAVIANP